MNIASLRSKFIERYGAEPRIFRAPGRVNIIGEHTDYNDGFVLPCAIDFAGYAAVAERRDRKIRVASLNYEGAFEFDLDAPEIEKSWVKYVQGTALTLDKTSRGIRGANLLIESDIPIGAGLSSSAALEIVVGFALSTLSEIRIDKWRLVKIGQTAEHEFAGVKSGIMDQFASAFGVENHALFLDCRSLEWSPIPLSNARFVICNTKTKHDLVESEYNRRRADCEAAAAFFGRASLRDVSLPDFKEKENDLPERLRKRARHVLTENERVLNAVSALRNGDLRELGRLMNASHESLRDDFQVSSRELDAMVEIARRQKSLVGARMTGGGFGGCTINLFAGDVPPDFVENVSAEYRKITGIAPEIYVCQSAPGVGELKAEN